MFKDVFRVISNAIEHKVVNRDIEAARKETLSFAEHVFNQCNPVMLQISTNCEIPPRQGSPAFSLVDDSKRKELINEMERLIREHDLDSRGTYVRERNARKMAEEYASVSTSEVTDTAAFLCVILTSIDNVLQNLRFEEAFPTLATFYGLFQPAMKCLVGDEAPAGIRECWPTISRFYEEGPTTLSMPAKTPTQT